MPAHSFISELSKNSSYSTQFVAHSILAFLLTSKSYLSKCSFHLFYLIKLHSIHSLFFIRVFWRHYWICRFQSLIYWLNARLFVVHPLLSALSFIFCCWQIHSQFGWIWRLMVHSGILLVLYEVQEDLSSLDYQVASRYFSDPLICKLLTLVTKLKVCFWAHFLPFDWVIWVSMIDWNYNLMIVCAMSYHGMFYFVFIHQYFDWVLQQGRYCSFYLLIF